MLISKDVPLDWAQQEALFLGWVPCYCDLNSLLFFKPVYKNLNKHWGSVAIRAFPNIKKQKIPC